MKLRKKKGFTPLDNETQNIVSCDEYGIGKRRSFVRNNKCKHRSLTGFTLIEVVVAMTIGVIAILAIIFAIVTFHGASEIASDRRVAIYHAEKVVEHMRRLSNSRTLKDCVTGTWSLSNWSNWAATDDDTMSATGELGGGCNTLDQEVVTVNVGGGGDSGDDDDDDDGDDDDDDDEEEGGSGTNANPLDVTVNVRWQTRGRRIQCRLWTKMAKRA